MNRAFKMPRYRKAKGDADTTKAAPTNAKQPALVNSPVKMIESKSEDAMMDGNAKIAPTYFSQFRRFARIS